MMYKICLVEDEENLNQLIKSYLTRAGYEVVNFLNGEDAMNYIGNEVHLWILDIMLGDQISGYDIIKKIREESKDVPVIFTSARDQDLDKIIGLELGSDDYVTKPYSPKELVLRVNNMMKRVYDNHPSDKVTYEDYEINLSKRMVYQQGKEINLTTLEFDLLLLFINHKNKSFSRDDILKNVWGEDYFGSDRVVDDLVRRLRKKMPNLHINTLYGFGYRLI
ncbi:MAG TPA: response regulator transcription factor [Candidatus Fimihabitans intestinipullorum]|uniref:Response regulator transcription factor n=1 Tax=Candidatus Fimihabitans intestinipullorum TaxID=2840820 RepID=A0A9D1L4A4_9BACT|nr:response regulator transcription factor [Candidatus Fimihabitans intestinipullorum]